MLTFDQLLVFHKIVQTGSFKSAAMQLHKTQPAISFSIKKLEEEMGVELFDRSSYRPSLNSYGKVLLEKSLPILQALKDLENLGQTFKQHEEPEVGISIDGIGLNNDLLKFLKNFSDQHPYTKLNMCLDLLSEAERRVIAGETDIGITHFIKEYDALEIIPFSSVSMVPVINKDLYKKKKIKEQKDLIDIEQIVISDKNPNGASFGLLDNGKKWRVLDNNFKRQIILSGLGWGHLQLSSIERELKEKKLIVLEFHDIRPRALDIHLIRLRNHHFGPIAKKLWDDLISFHV
jgi:DNA-binding transcriptional LysR family regulator